MRKFFIAFLGVFLLGGCGLWSHSVTPSISETLLIENGQVVQLKRLRTGGNLVVVPFTAGVGVEAGDQVDRISLMVVKGMVDVLQKDGKPLNVIFTQDVNQADLAIRGHITKQETNKVFKGWGWRKEERVLAVDGEMIDVKTAEPVCVFSHSRRSLGDEQDLAYSIGQDIGRFLAHAAR